MSTSDNIGSPRKALVIRYGAFGDAVMITPVLRLLKEEGYEITLNCSEYCRSVFDSNPNIDHFIVHTTNSIPNNQLDKYWEEMGKGYDRVINLSESIERTLLKMEGDAEFKWSHEKRHSECNVNYYDRTLELSGFKQRGVLPELHWSREEETWAQKLRWQYRSRFLILWSLSGSSFHKVYHAADEVARRFLDNHSDAVTITVGGDMERLLEWDHPSTRKKCGVWSIRKSMIMTKYANLVVGTETGIMNASACYDTPKVIMLSHSSEENLTKYWKNCTALHSNVPCYPCHQLHYTLGSCPLEKISDETPLQFTNDKIKFRTREEYPACMAKLNPIELYDVLEEYYDIWKGGVQWRPQHSPLQLQS